MHDHRRCAMIAPMKRSDRPAAGQEAPMVIGPRRVVQLLRQTVALVRAKKTRRHG
jgi:hypothetical protein